MSSLGIDYNSRIACYGLVSDGKLIASGAWNFDGGLVKTNAEMRTSLQGFSDLLVNLSYKPPMKVFVERPLALTAALPMAMMASRLITIAQLAGFDVYTPAPQTWRKVVFGHGTPENPKQRAVDYVKEHFGYEPPSLKVRSYEADHNRCEAICIAQYGELGGFREASSGVVQ